MRNPCKECKYYNENNNTCQSKKCATGQEGYISIFDRLFCEPFKETSSFDVNELTSIMNTYSVDNTKLFIENIKELHQKSGFNLIDCKKVILEHPNVTYEEQIIYLKYYEWLRGFYDGGDKSIERFKKEILNQ